MKRYGPIIGVFLAFAVAAFALVKVYERGKDSDRLLDTKIPQETIDWINNGMREGLLADMRRLYKLRKGATEEMIRRSKSGG